MSPRCSIPVRIPSQQIFPGRFEAAYRAVLRRLDAESVLARIWEGKPEVWKAAPEHAQVIRNRLGWLAAPVAMQAEVVSLEQFAAAVWESGVRQYVLLGMGGSSLAAEVFAHTFPGRPGAHFVVLDSTDPEMILRVERSLSWPQTLFVVASKSGTTVETLTQFRYFHDRLRVMGVTRPGAHFVAITDPGSPLERLAEAHQFRSIFRNDPTVGGRYSALSYFGLVPAALWGVPLPAVLEGALAMRAACTPDHPSASNPARTLGALLATAAQHGADKLVLLTTPALTSLADWIEQLIAESTGKEGQGIVPVAGEMPGPVEWFARDAVVACLTIEGDSRHELDAFGEQLSSHGVPRVEIRLQQPEDLGAEFFRWELATAVAGAGLGINPFDEPNVQESKDNTARILHRRSPEPTPVFTDGAIAVFAEGQLAARIASRRLGDALRALLAEPEPGGYLAVLAFLARTAEYEAALRALRHRLRAALPMTVLTGFGPRYLHSIGQLYKGGPPRGRFLMLTAEHTEDVLIPDVGYSFSQLELAQALGDFAALVQRGRPVLRLHFKQGAQAGLRTLQVAVDAALLSPPVPSS
ncbi:MAG: glucose-6-phosphate isomerase [Firmicutes bacterium]|nr:glucose-6-phosphate isomerase [Bacillota bacterium]